MKLVIFDMDGVLVDTETIYMQQIYELFINNGFKISKKDIFSIIGTTDEMSWKLLSEKVRPAISAKKIKELYYNEVDNNKMNFYDLKFPHVQQILTNLKKKGIKTAIASTSSINNIEKMMKQCDIEEKIDFYISGDSLAESKPNPEIYLKVMSKLNIERENTIIIEDSYSGIKAGKLAGAFVIAIKDTVFGIDQSYADIHLNNLLDAYNYSMKFFNQ